jgi:hypothetical protein
MQGHKSDEFEDMEFTREDAEISAGITPLDLAIKHQKRTILDSDKDKAVELFKTNDEFGY